MSTKMVGVPFCVIKEAASDHYLVKNLLGIKRCFGGHATMGIVTTGCNFDYCGTVAEMVAKGHISSGLEWLDPFLAALPSVYKVPQDDFMVIPSRYSDGGPLNPWTEAAREQEAARARAEKRRKQVKQSMEFKIMKIIQLPMYHIHITLSDTPGGGSIIWAHSLFELCPKCGQKNCVWSCDESHVGEVETEDQVSGRILYNGAVDGIMSMILAHACGGVNVEAPIYLEGIETALQAAANNT